MFFRVAPRGPDWAHVASPKQANKEANPATECHSARRVASVAKPGGEAKMTAQHGSLDPNRMTVEQAARVLSASGRKLVTTEMLQKDLDAGAPTNADGTINLIHFAGWLVKEMASGI